MGEGAAELLLLEPEGEAAPEVADATEPLAVGAMAAAQDVRPNSLNIRRQVVRTAGCFNCENGAGSVYLRAVLWVHEVDVISIRNLEGDIRH